MTTIHEMTATEQGRAVAAGELSPVEIAEHYLQRASERAWLGAFTSLEPERALRQARAAEAAVRGGTPLSPLHGVPVPVKDLVNVAGVRCTYGSAAFADRVARHDDDVVAALDVAGTVMLGKTNTPEFALPCYTENAIFPPTENPWKTGFSPGGSSGGAGAAVAAGLAPVAHGTDAGGSVRIPASTCGLVGLKPTRGLISNGPSPDPLGISSHGALARSVEDAAALLDVMSGAWRSDIAALRHPAEPGRLRCAILSDSIVPGVPTHDDCRQAQRVSVDYLIELGHEVAQLDLPFGPDLVKAFGTVLAAAAAMAPVPDEDVLMPFTRGLRSQAQDVAGPDQLRAALATFERATSVLTTTVFESYDVIVTPTLAQPPLQIGALRDDSDSVREFAKMAAFMPFTPLANITGGPSMSLPLHQNDSGLPVGVMFTADRNRESKLIALGHQLEGLVGWRARHPEVW